AELYRDRVFRFGKLLITVSSSNTVRTAQLLANDLQQPCLQYFRHRPDRDSPLWLKHKRTSENNRRATLRFDPFLNLLLNNTFRQLHANILPRLFSFERRKRAKITLDERLHRRLVKTADKVEREVTRIRETILVERQRLVEIPLVNGCGCW